MPNCRPYQLLALLAALIFYAAPLGADKPPDTDYLRLLGKTNAKRLRKEQAHWRIIHRSWRSIVRVDVVWDGGNHELTMEHIYGRSGVEQILKLVAHGGLWYVKEKDQLSKYRAYEALLSKAWAVPYLQMSRPLFAHNIRDLGRRVRIQDGEGYYRSALSAAERKLVQTSIKNTKQWLKRYSTRISAAQRRFIDRWLRKVESIQAKGKLYRVNLNNGLVVEVREPRRILEVQYFSFQGRKISAPKGNWTDYSGDPTTHLSELAMIGHSANWRTGQPRTDARLTAQLLDLRNGQVRRVPYRGPYSRPGCFLRDRSKLIVLGGSADVTDLGLFLIDLKTGANRQLGRKLLARGHLEGPTVSPSGKQLAVLHSQHREDEKRQIFLVDLESGKARPLGKQLAADKLCWLQDGSGLLIGRRAKDAALRRMSLAGALTSLRSGAHPVLLPGGRILFRDNAGFWQTCDATGKNVRSYANGFRGYDWPTPSPDGKRVLMLRMNASNGPQPTIFTLGTNKRGRAIGPSGGLWGQPAWR